MGNILIVGGGIAGVTVAWQLHRLGRPFTLYEASDRLGGTVKTVRRDGFTMELGPDGWVTEKPWAAELARDLGLGGDLTPSLDAERVTYLLSQGSLAAMPQGMRMMVPTDLEEVAASPLFSAEAHRAYALELTRADELRSSAPPGDESVASFVCRHFGVEVLEKLAGPLLSGVFGGDVQRLSVRAVMPALVQMERDHGSLICALRDQVRSTGSCIFTTLRSGVQSLVDAMAGELPASSVQLKTPVISIEERGGGWVLERGGGGRSERCEHVVLATPAQGTRRLLSPVSSRVAELLDVEATSAVIAAFAFDEDFELPKGFGFLVPFSEGSPLLACTFVDQKFAGRAPSGKHLLRAFFGGAAAPAVACLPDHEVAALALLELRKILGPLPAPAFDEVQRWPQSLPQYAVGHLERMAELERLVGARPGLHLAGNTYRGVGLPDLIRDGRALGRRLGG